MRIIDAIERRAFSLPIREVMNEEGDLSFIQNINNKGYFNVQFQASKLTLVAGNYIGQIPLTTDITVNVKPKVPINNLARIISLGNQPIQCLDYFRRTYETQGKASQTLQEAIALSLVTSLKKLDAEGIYREYLKRDEKIVGLRGRINLPVYIRDKVSRYNLSRLPCTFYELSADTILNRVIKKAIYKIGFALASLKIKDGKLLADLNYYANRFGNVKHDESKFLESNLRDYLSHISLPVLRQYYLEIMDACLIILEGSGVELINESGTSTLYSFIVNLENAFEQYVREVLRQSVKLNTPIPQILDGNKEGISFLFTDNKKFEAKPDIVIGQIGNVLAIGDVKYKEKLVESDRYQLITHALSYGAKCAFFITPLNEKGIGVPDYVGKVGDIEVYHYQIDLDNTDLSISELALQEWVIKITAKFIA